MSPPRPPSARIAVGRDPYPDLPGIDPSAVCDQCGQVGTVARASRTDTVPPTLERYCEACWPAQHQASQDAAIPMWWHVESWRFVRSFLSELAPLLSQPLRPNETLKSREDFGRGVAADIARNAERYAGPMPPDVRAFIDKYGP